MRYVPKGPIFLIPRCRTSFNGFGELFTILVWCKWGFDGPTQMGKSMMAFKGASTGLSLHSCWSYTSTEYVVKHREEEGWRLTFSGHVPDNQCFFPSMCPQLSWVHRSFHQPQIFFSFASGWRDLLSHYFTTSLVTAETNRISILPQSWWISQEIGKTLWVATQMAS